MRVLQRPCRILQARDRIDPPRLERGHKAEERARQHGRGARESQHAAVQAAGRGRQRKLGGDGRAQERQRDAAQAAKQRDQKALRQELLHHPSAADTEREAHGDLAPSRRGARQQQVGHVRAGDQQEQPGGERHRDAQRGGLVHRAAPAVRGEISSSPRRHSPHTP